MARNWIILLIVAFAMAAFGYVCGRRAALQPTHEADTVAAPASANHAPDAPAGGITQRAEPTTRPTVQRASVGAGSNGSARPLPPSGTPLAEVFDDLKRRADAGDPAAASRLFQDLQKCAEAQRIGRYLPAVANRMLEGNLPSSPDEIERGERQLDRLQRGLELQQSSATMCAGLTATQRAALVPTTLAAAQLGDAQAADCYVGANLNAWPGVIDNPGWLGDYRNNALPLANAAVQRGDWAMVGLLASANAGGMRSNNNLLNQVTGSDPLQAYTYAKLMSLGQPPGTNASTRSATALTALSSQLTPEQIQAADAQAQSFYRQYFNATPRQPGVVANAMRACGAGF